MTYPRRPTRGELLEEARAHLQVLRTMLKALDFNDGSHAVKRWIHDYDLHHRTKVTRTIERAERRRGT